MLAELVVQTSTAFVLAGNCLGRIQTIELRVPRKVWRRKQLLCVTDHVLVNHASRNLVARRIPRRGGLDIARCRERIAGWVAQERLPAIRVVDLSRDPGEIATQLRHRRRNVAVGGARVVSIAFVAEEEEGFPLMFSGDGQRTTKGRTKLILLKLGLRPSWDQGIESVKSFVSNKLPPRPVEARGPGFSNHIDDSAHYAAKRCVIVVRLNLELLDVVDNRRNGVGAAERPLVVHPVKQE